MTFVLTITAIMSCVISQLAVPGYATLNLCEAAGKNQVAQTQALYPNDDVIKTFTCDLQSEADAQPPR